MHQRRVTGRRDLRTLIARIEQGSAIEAPDRTSEDLRRLIAAIADLRREAHQAQARAEDVARCMQDLEAELEARTHQEIRDRSAQAAAFARLGEALEQLALGDLQVRLEAHFPTGLDQLRIDFNASMEALGRVMASILEATEAVSFGASELSRAAQRLSSRTDQQAQSVRSSATSLEALFTEVMATHSSAGEVQAAVGKARSVAEGSDQLMRRSVDAMGRIQDSSSHIGQISSVIDELAFQTNLLALNAGVEAARAGDAGRGFAVVAQEVRALAERSAKAAREIKALVERSRGDVRNGAQQIAETQRGLADIVAQVIGIHQVVEDIARSSHVQRDSIATISQAMAAIDQVTHNNVAMVAEATEASRLLADEAQTLTAAISKFKTSDETEEQNVADATNAEIDRLFA